MSYITRKSGDNYYLKSSDPFDQSVCFATCRNKLLSKTEMLSVSYTVYDQNYNSKHDLKKLLP